MGISVEHPTGRPDISEETARIVDEETARILREEYDRARGILEKQKDLLSRLSRLLMVRETLEGSELKAYVDGSKTIPDPEEERDRLAREHAAQRKAEEEKREAREEEEREAAAAVPRATEGIPTPPHLREPTEELRP